jgi:regulator of replication initiation timing
MMAIHNH